MKVDEWSAIVSSRARDRKENRRQISTNRECLSLVTQLPVSIVIETVEYRRSFAKDEKTMLLEDPLAPLDFDRNLRDPRTATFDPSALNPPVVRASASLI